MKKKRTIPYTEIGIRRLGCARCGKQAEFQWRACALGEWKPVCRICDEWLNEMVLRFMRVGTEQKVAEIMKKYREKKRG